MDENRKKWLLKALPIGLIIVVSALVFLPFAAQLGFYRDDWYMLWSANLRGAGSIIDLFSIDRPFMGYTYALTYRWLGNAPFTWQLYAVMLKTLGAISVYGIMRLIWPEQRLAATAAALLYLVYPGFLGQPNAATKTNQLLSLTAELWSIWLSGLALQTRRKGLRLALVASAMAFGLLNYLLYEYMIGLETLRVGVFWLVQQQTAPLNLRLRSRRLVRDYLPYVGVILVFLVWRLGFFKSTRDTTDQFSVVQSILENPRSLLVYISLESIMDPLETVILAWGVPFERYVDAEKPRNLAAALLAGTAIAALVLGAAALEKRRYAQDDGGQGRGRALWVCIVGLVALFGTILPVLAVGRDVDFSGGFDKYTLHASPAAAILLSGFIFGFIQGRGRFIFLGLLIFLGVSTHVLNAYHWQRFWENEKTLWWQLWWRAPGLEDGTILLASIPEEGFFEDYEIWGPANLIYRPQTQRITIGAEVINPVTVGDVRAGRVGERRMRGLEYSRDFNHSLLLALPADNSCLKVVDRDDISLPMRFAPTLVPILRFSYIDQIDLTAAYNPPPSAIFGPEPAHDWCYFYQTAERAKQAGDWAAVNQLGDQVLAGSLKPIDRAEWLPFLEGYIWAGDDAKADVIATEINDDPVLAKDVCDALGINVYPFGPEIQQGMVQVLCER